MQRPEQDLARVQAWIIETMDIFGGSADVANTVARTFAQGVRAEWAKQSEDSREAIAEAALRWKFAGYSLMGDELMDLMRAIEKRAG